MIAKSYKGTITGCFTGYIVQAIVNIFVPMLFITFQTEYGVPLAQITALITINFAVQLSVDLLSAVFLSKVGYRAAIYFAHAMCAAGLIFLTFLPSLFGNAFFGLLLSVIFYAIGGGLLEVLISPMVEACPTENKARVMSVLHSFYCWGSVGVILVSTAFFALFGTEKWRILSIVWAILPVANLILFTKVPIYTLEDETGEKTPLSTLFKNKLFWLFMVVMLCAGASEQVVSQWASAFCEGALGISKTAGDLAGPAMFSVLMGLSRLLYGKFGDKFNPYVVMAISGFGCAGAYVIAALCSLPALSLLGVALAGFFCGIMWPATYSNGAQAIKGGGTAMFALFALAGDLGCSSGPTVAGIFASAFGDDLKKGILCSVGFPAVLAIVMLLFAGFIKRQDKNGLPPLK